MKIFNFLKIAAFGILGVISASCESDDNVKLFDQDPIHRVTEAERLLKENLVASENGWVVTYFPTDEMLGGYNFWFKFNEDGSLLTRSDFDVNDMGIKNEQYDFVLLNTIALNFPLGATIHKFPALSNSSTIYKTDIEFLFQSYEGEDILFKGHTTKNKIQFNKATAEDKQFDLSKNHAFMNSMRNFKTLFLFEGPEISSFNFRYNANTRYASVLSADRTESVNANGGVGIGFGADRIIVSPAIEFEDGSTISELKLENGEFVGIAGSNRVIIR